MGISAMVDAGYRNMLNNRGQLEEHDQFVAKQRNRFNPRRGKGLTRTAK